MMIPYLSPLLSPNAPIAPSHRPKARRSRREAWSARPVGADIFTSTQPDPFREAGSGDTASVGTVAGGW